MKEGYHRLYNKIVEMHMLSEMEEVVSYKKSESEGEMLKKRDERKDRLYFGYFRFRGF